MVKDENGEENIFQRMEPRITVRNKQTKTVQKTTTKEQN